MKAAELLKYRLLNQQLAAPSFKDAAAAVSHMGAIQAQDYGAAKWALRQRVQGATDAAIEQAFTDGDILRTHVMRPTWHFVTPTDIRWLLQLTAPRVIAQSAGQYRTYGLDDKTFSASNKALTKALQGTQLNRAELAAVLEKAKIKTDELRFTLIMMRAELDGLICSGARQGKQFTYALMDDRAPAATITDMDEALAELTIRYFTSHGPATLQDFAWWSGLTLTMVRTGMEMVRNKFTTTDIDGKAYYYANALPDAEAPKHAAYLLPNYDEYIVAYKDRTALIDANHIKKLDARENALFNNVIILDGVVAGIWKRTLRSKEVIVETTPCIPLNKAQKNAIAEAIARYKEFMHSES